MKPGRNYPLLLASQFLGAFGDLAILSVILGQLTFLQRDGVITPSQVGTANAFYTALLYVPYVLLAPLAGFLNDRFAKTRWLLGGNAIKIVGAAVASLSVVGGPVWQGVGYLIVGVGGCIYSPAKYGILPEIVPYERLVRANGLVELLTLVAILTGNIGGAAMVDALPVWVCYCVLLGIYALSLVLNLFMTPTPAHANVRLRATLGEFLANFGDLLAGPRLLRMLAGTCTFWVCGAVLKMNLQPWGLGVLHLTNNKQIALLGLWLSLGIMAGSVLAGRLYALGDLRHTRRYGWGLAGSIGVLGLVELLEGAEFLRSHGPIIFLLAAAGVLAGLFLIPLNAGLQAESHPDKVGKTIATQNFLDNLGMVLAGGVVYVGVGHGLGPSGVFLGLSGLVALVVTALKVPPKAQAARV